MGILRRFREWREDKDGVLTGPDINADSLNTDDADIKRSGDHVYAWAFDGGDVETRLDNALAEATDGDTIYLEKGTYPGPRTVSKLIRFVGTGTQTRTDIQDWTVTVRARFTNVAVSASGSVTLQGGRSQYRNADCGVGSTLNVEADNVSILGCDELDVTFASGTSGGLVDSCTNTPITDSGTNNVGDVT